MTSDIVVHQQAAIRLPQEWEWSMMERYANAAVKSGLVTGNMRPDQALFIILKGYELNITPIQALSDIHLINGKPGLSVQLMISLANRSGMLTHLEMPDADEAFKSGKATVSATRKDRPESPISMTFTIADAEKAGLMRNPTWKSYPGQMLVNRAVSMVLRRIIPEALSGMYLDEELETIEHAAPNITISEIKRELPPVTVDMLRYDDAERFPRFLAWAQKTYGMNEAQAMEALYAINGAKFTQATSEEAKQACETWHFAKKDAS
jgi:hypothetical protein